MRLYLLAIFLSSRAVNSGPLIFDDSTLSEPGGLSTVDGGNTADTGQVMQLPLESSLWNQVDVLPNNQANDLTDYQIPDSTSNGTPNLLADLPVAACLDGKTQVKGSATKKENSCPAPLDTSPSGQSTEDGRQQQEESGNKPKPDEKKDDQPVVNTNPFDNICPPPKRIFCCLGRVVPNWNSRQGCEELTSLEECHNRGGFPFCCVALASILSAEPVRMIQLGIGCEQDPVTANKFPPPDNVIKFPTFPADIIPLLRNPPQPPPKNPFIKA